MLHRWSTCTANGQRRPSPGWWWAILWAASERREEAESAGEPGAAAEVGHIPRWRWWGGRRLSQIHLNTEGAGCVSVMIYVTYGCSDKSLKKTTRLTSKYGLLVCNSGWPCDSSSSPSSISFKKNFCTASASFKSGNYHVNKEHVNMLNK